MVLRLTVLLLLAGCLHAQPVARLPEPAKAAVAVVLDTDAASDLVAQARPALTDELTRRNLEPAWLGDLPPLERTTQARLAALDGQAEYAVLVEARVGFYAQLEGRYRWTVKTRITVAHDGESQSEDFDVPVVLEFAHEGAQAAFDAALPAIGRHLGQLLDRTLPGLSKRPPAASGLRDSNAIYFVLVDRFKNGDRSNDADADPSDPQGFMGGDLAGVDQSVAYIADLGFDQVWLSPVARTRTEKFEGHGAYHGYWTWDPTAIEPRFGDDTILRKLRADLAARGIGLVLDIVMNHVAWDSPVRSEHPDWFHHRGAISDWDDQDQVENGDVFGLPDLALEQNEVFAFMRDAALGWLHRAQPAGFRLDALRHVPLSVWGRFTREVRAQAGPGFFLLGELLDGAPTHLARAFRLGGFDALFDFPLAFAMRDVFCGDAPAARLGAVLTADRLYPAGKRLVTLLDNHDLPRIASVCNGDLGKVEQALTFMLTARGIPSIMYGTEQGMQGAEEPANRAAMAWDAPAPLAAVIKKWLAERRKDDALSAGRDVILVAGNELFAYARVGQHGGLAIAVNTGERAVGFSVGQSRIQAAPGVSVSALPEGELPRLRQLAGRRGERAGSITTGALPDCKGGEWLAVGSSAALGDWSPARGLVLHGSTSVSWPENGVVELKLAYRMADGTVVWSEGDNSIAFAAADGQQPLTINLAWSGPSPCLP